MRVDFATRRTVSVIVVSPRARKCRHRCRRAARFGADESGPHLVVVEVVVLVGDDDADADDVGPRLAVTERIEHTDGRSRVAVCRDGGRYRLIGASSFRRKVLEEIVDIEEITPRGVIVDVIDPIADFVSVDPAAKN